MTARRTFIPCARHFGGDYECCDGVVMDADEYHEGWQRDVLYPPCPHCNPRCCLTCKGTDSPPEAIKEAHQQDDCPDCNGGWKGKPMWPRRRVSFRSAERPY